MVSSGVTCAGRGEVTEVPELIRFHLRRGGLGHVPRPTADAAGAEVWAQVQLLSHVPLPPHRVKEWQAGGLPGLPAHQPVRTAGFCHFPGEVIFFHDAMLLFF